MRESGAASEYADQRETPREWFIQMKRGTRSGFGGLAFAVAVSGSFLALLLGLIAFGYAPAAVLVGYAMVSAVLFAMYGRDKAAAQSGARRTPEATLHLVALAGGWPGGLVAQRVFRHKTQKQPFQAVFWCTAVANCVVLVGVLAATTWGV